MADETSTGDGEKAKTKDKKPATKRAYAVLGAVGDKNAEPTDLDFRVIDVVEAATTSAAKSAVLEANPEFPRLDGSSSGPHSGAGGEDLAAQPTDLQSLVRGERLWLHAESGFNPKPVLVEQPPPRFKGL